LIVHPSKHRGAPAPRLLFGTLRSEWRISVPRRHLEFRLKPSPFQYLRPTSSGDAVLMLKEHRDDCKILAGGQSLVPILNFRLAAPAVLIDINEIAELDHIVSDDDGLTLGALVRWNRIETDPQIEAVNPLLAEAVRHVAHYQIRNRGTWAGSSVHADPAAEFPAVAIACGAEFTLRSAEAARIVDAERFFVDALTTAIEPDELLVAVRFPAWPKGRAWAFEEFAIRQGDFALAGIVAIVDPGADVRLVCFGAGSRQSRLQSAERVIASEGLSRAAIERAAEAAAKEVGAQGDIHASADYRRALVETLVRRTLGKIAGIEVEP
jgi:carbon-monoxide dehydrogenase medium subunit